MASRTTGHRRALWAGMVVGLVLLGQGLLAGCMASDSGEPTKAEPEESGASAEKVLFDGKTLAGWKVSDFAGHGEVVVKDGQIILEMGPADLTGITWTGGDLPKMDYEITLEAARLDGNDFFCGLTFPVNDSCCSLVCGGWGGTIVGLSCLDGFDAANNETTKFKEFDTGTWYEIRVRVTESKIEAWIDDEPFVDANTEGRKIGVRMEVEASQPFGIAAWRTKAGVRNIHVRPLPE